jgi:Ca2+-transporting ATPase
MIDPPRRETKDALELCKQAGIKVLMLTGDHKNTALAVAKEIGLMEKGKKVLSALELDKLSDTQLNEIIEDVSVFARVSPRHKLRIVSALKQRGHIVAVTGDGVNDAPALKEAHIGVAMGIKGTDVAKEASQMILADDNFATIVNAVEEGRGIYDNIRKFIKYILCLNFSLMFFIGITTILKMPLPLLPIQILWLNLLTDGLPALGLTVDPKDPDIMRRKPRNPKESVWHGMKMFILVVATLELLIQLGVFVWACTGGFSYVCTANSPTYHKSMTLVLTAAITFELFFVFNCRSETKPFFRINPLKNKRLVLAVIITALLHLMIVYIPIFNSYFGTVPLGINEWLVIILLAFSGLLIPPRIFFAKK